MGNNFHLPQKKEYAQPVYSGDKNIHQHLWNMMHKRTHEFLEIYDFF